ncbi:MAG: AIR carboxylase family protein [Deltaproteobacteria bacterium]|nr:AIR carboxylase family protein [Deltaproteobacteria bacterium]
MGENHLDKKKPIVAIVMGSKSDLPVMKEAVDVLVGFGVPREVRVISVHRTPERAGDFARDA